MRKSISIALLLSASVSCFALQSRTVSDNGSAQAFIAQEGLTRIAVANDRISHVRGPEGVYEITLDNAQGAIFVHPTGDQPQPFTLFLATEHNHNYVLHLTPQQRTADTLVLKPKDSVSPQAKHWEEASPYTEAVAKLMAGMTIDKAPEGYGVTAVKGKPSYLGAIAKVQLLEVYDGAHLQGQVYQVTNRTGQPITLTERAFYQPGDRAIALTRHTVAPYGQTQLYKVANHGE